MRSLCVVGCAFYESGVGDEMQNKAEAQLAAGAAAWGLTELGKTTYRGK